MKKLFRFFYCRLFHSRAWRLIGYRYDDQVVKVLYCMRCSKVAKILRKEVVQPEQWTFSRVDDPNNWECHALAADTAKAN